MKLTIGALLLVVASAFPAHGWAKTLPPSCGDDGAVFEVATHKNHPAPAPPEAGKARVVFVEMADKDALPVTTRVALDGSWVGANKGNSYFESTLLPGEHHVCVDWQLARRYLKDSPAFEIFTAEAGKTYYFVIKVGWTANVGAVRLTRYDGDMTLSLSAVNEDEGWYLAQTSKSSTATRKK
jgi:hypothetical protein